MVEVTVDGALWPGEAWPLTLLVEAMAQAILLVVPRPGGGEVRLVALDRVQQLREVVAGDRLEVAVEAAGSFGPLHRFSCKALCAGALVATAEVTVSG